jgi:hypothetical protein
MSRVLGAVAGLYQGTIDDCKEDWELELQLTNGAGPEVGVAPEKSEPSPESDEANAAFPNCAVHRAPMIFARSGKTFLIYILY